MKVTCQYSGIVFEAQTARTKNHPAVAAFINEIANDKFAPARAYGEAKVMLQNNKDRWQTVSEYLAAVTAEYTAWTTEAKATESVEAKAKAQAAKAQAEAWRKRRETNQVLYKAGYYWMRVTDEDLHGEDAEAGWSLIAPDGSTTTVAAALATIKASK